MTVARTQVKSSQLETKAYIYDCVKMSINGTYVYMCPWIYSTFFAFTHKCHTMMEYTYKYLYNIHCSVLVSSSRLAPILLMEIYIFTL